MYEIYVYPLLSLLFVALFTREVIAPASKNRCDRRWLILSSALATSTLITALLMGYFFSANIRDIALFPTAGKLSDLSVGFLSFLVNSFIFYWWHRLTHASDFLWRCVHQLHHSARRVEALTAFYAHPFETASAVLLGIFSSYILLGATPLAAAIALLLTGIFDLFLHSDMRTPTWLGYFVQRPEMHSLHHQRDYHQKNYGLPVWDLLFGTWVNPTQRVQELGFDETRSDRITDMLMLKDVHKV